MIKTKTFVVIGGDLRQVHLANTLASKGNGYKIYGMFFGENVKLSPAIHKSDDLLLVLPQCDVVIFPLPMIDSEGNINTPLSDNKISLESCIDYLSPDCIVLAGKISCSTVDLLEAAGVNYFDYLQREEFAVLNAVPTAEGAIEIALRELPITLMDADCLIIGYGRISKLPY